MVVNDQDNFSLYSKGEKGKIEKNICTIEALNLFIWSNKAVLVNVTKWPQMKIEVDWSGRSAKSYNRK